MKSIRNACMLRTMAKPAVFNPPPGITAEYNTMTFPSTYKCVDQVGITLLSAAAPGDALTVVVAFDNFSYVARVTQ